MKKEEKAKVGRPKLADEQTKKKAIKYLALSGILLTMLILGAAVTLFDAFDLNLLKGDSSGYKVCYQPNDLKVTQGGKWCQNISSLKFSLKNKLTPVVNNYNDKNQYNRAIIGYSVAYKVKTNDNKTKTYFLNKDAEWVEESKIKNSEKKNYSPEAGDIRLSGVPKGATVQFSASWIEVNAVYGTYDKYYSTISWKSKGAFKKKAKNLNGSDETFSNIKNSYENSENFYNQYKTTDKTITIKLNFEGGYYVKDKLTYNENFTVKFSKNDSDGKKGVTGSMSNQTVKYSKTTALSKNIFTSSKYKFRAWRARRSDGAYLAVDKDGKNAIWIPKKSGCTSGTCHTLPSGYKWKEYKESKDGVTANVKSLIKNGQTVTMVAQWKEKGKFTVKFHPNGGTGNMKDQKVYYGTKTPLTKNAFKKELYTFNGWNAFKVDSKGNHKYLCTNDKKDDYWTDKGMECKDGYYLKVYKDGGNVQYVGDEGETVYMLAKWKQTHFKVEYVCDKEKYPTCKGSMASETLKLGETHNMKENAFSVEGYKFKGYALRYNYLDGTKEYIGCTYKGECEPGDAQLFSESEVKSYWYFQPYGARDLMASESITYTLFAEFEKDASATTKKTNATTTKATPNKNTTTTTTKAVPSDSFMVVFVANNGTNETKEQTIKHGTKTKLESNTFSNGNETFEGWIAKRNVNGKDLYRGCTSGSTCSNSNAKWLSSKEIKSYYIYTNGISVSKTAPKGETVYMIAKWTNSTDKFIVNGFDNNRCQVINAPSNANYYRIATYYKKQTDSYYGSNKISDLNENHYNDGQKTRVVCFLKQKSNNETYRIMVKKTSGANDKGIRPISSWKPNGWYENESIGWAYKDINYNW